MMRKHLNLLIEYSIYLFVFLLPLQTRWIIASGVFNGGFFEYGTISLYLTDLILIFLLIIITITKLYSVFAKNTSSRADSTTEPSLLLQSLAIKTSPEFRLDAVWALIAIIDLFIFLSCFRAPDKMIALYSYGRFLMGVALFYILTSSKFAFYSALDKRGESEAKSETFPFVVLRKIRALKLQLNAQKSKLVFVFLASAFFQSLLAIYQVIAQSTFANKYLGLATHLPETLGTSVVELSNGTRWLRAYGSLDHPNMLGGLMVFAVMLALIELLKVSSGLLFQVSMGKTKIMLLLSLAFSTITLFFTFSRSAWLATAAGIVAVLFFSVVTKRLKMQKLILQVILLMALISFILFVFFSDLVTTRISANTRLEQKSSIERLDSNREAIEIIKDNWLLGVGVGNYTQYLQKQNSESEVFVYQPVHNIILLVAVEIGIVALFAFIFLILYLLFNRRTYSLNSFLLVPVLLLFLLDHWLWSLHFGVFLFWLIMSFCYFEKRLIP